MSAGTVKVWKSHKLMKTRCFRVCLLLQLRLPPKYLHAGGWASLYLGGLPELRPRCCFEFTSWSRANKSVYLHWKAPPSCSADIPLMQSAGQPHLHYRYIPSNSNSPSVDPWETLTVISFQCDKVHLSQLFVFSLLTTFWSMTELYLSAQGYFVSLLASCEQNKWCHPVLYPLFFWYLQRALLGQWGTTFLGRRHAGLFLSLSCFTRYFLF